MAKDKKKHLQDSDSPSLMPSPADFIGWVLLLLVVFAVYAVSMVLWNTFHQAVNEVQSTTKHMSDWTKKNSEKLFQKTPQESLPITRRPESGLSGQQVFESFKQQFEKASKEVSELVRGEPQKQPFDRGSSPSSTSGEAGQP